MAADGHKAALAHEKGGDPLVGRTAGGYCNHLDQIAGISTTHHHDPADK